MVAPSDSLWLLIRPFFKNCKLRAPPGNPGETLPPRPRVRPPHENSTSILQAFLLPKHVPHCLPVTARSSSPPSGQPAFARCTQTAHCAPRQWQHGGAKRNTNQGGDTHSGVHCYQPSSLLAADATSLHDTRSPGCHHLPATQLTWRVLQVPDMGNDMWPQHAHWLCTLDWENGKIANETWQRPLQSYTVRKWGHRHTRRGHYKFIQFNTQEISTVVLTGY